METDERVKRTNMENIQVGRYAGDLEILTSLSPFREPYVDKPFFLEIKRNCPGLVKRAEKYQRRRRVANARLGGSISFEEKRERFRLYMLE